MYQLHRTFGHPSTTALGTLLTNSYPTRCNNIKHTLERIGSDCMICKHNFSAAICFTLTVDTGYLAFNNTFQLNTIFIADRPVLHMVYLATHFSAAFFLRKRSTADIWK